MRTRIRQETEFEREIRRTVSSYGIGIGSIIVGGVIATTSPIGFLFVGVGIIAIVAGLTRP